MNRQRIKNSLLLPALAIIFGSLSLANSLCASTLPTPILIGTSSDGLKLLIVPEGPSTRHTQLQISCFFAHNPNGDVYSGGTAVFVQKMGGLITALRSGNGFAGYELETLLLTPPPNTIPARRLLLIGLGDQSKFSADTMRGIGITAAREAMRLGVSEVSFSPNVADAGVHTVPVGVSAEATLEGVIVAFHTQVMLAEKGAGEKPILKQFTLEAGKEYLPTASQGIAQAIETVNAQIKAEPDQF